MKSFIAFLLVAISIQFVRAQSSDERTVQEIEKRRFDAQVSRDYTVLDQVLADDLVYTHSNGLVDTKQSFIQSLKDGKTQYNSITPQEQTVRIYGNIAVGNGVAAVQSTSNGQQNSLRLRYLDVYKKQGKNWQLVAWQSLRI